MKRINVMVSDEAKKKIVAYQVMKGFSTLDETMDDFILNNCT